MAYSFRSVSAGVGNSSGSTLTISKPSGTTDGDLLIAIFYLESDTNTWSSVPSGWQTGPTIANAGEFKLHLFWKIASSEPASWNWTPTSSAWRAGFCAAYSGALGTDLSRVEISGGSQGDSVSPATSQTAPSITTSTDADLVVFVYGNFSGTDATAITGFASNNRQTFGGLLLADAIKTPAGATGTTAPSSGVGTQDYAAMHVAFLLDTGGGGGGHVDVPPVDYSRHPKLSRLGRS